MSDGSSVIVYLKTLKNQEASGSRLERAADEIYRRYIQRLQEHAKSRLPLACGRVADEEDIAQAAMASFFRCAKIDRFPKLDDQHDLWQVLIELANRKAVDQRRRETAKKRGAGKVRGESAFEKAGDSGSEIVGLDGHPEGKLVPDHEPTPDEAAQVAEHFQRWMDLLDAVDRQKPEKRICLQQVAQLRFEGYTVAEIAERFQCATRTIERQLGIIRNIWTKHQEREFADQTDPADSCADGF